MEKNNAAAAGGEERTMKKLQYNSPVILTFFLLSLGVLLLDWLTSGWTTLHAFCVYRSSLADPLFYVRLFGHVLGHADFDHFLGNMLLLFGDRPAAGGEVRQPHLLAGILLTAGVSGILQCVFSPAPALLGASGIVFMLIMLASPGGHEGRPHPPDADPGSGPVSGAGGVRHGGPAGQRGQLHHLVGGVTGTVFGVVLAKRR